MQRKRGSAMLIVLGMCCVSELVEITCNLEAMPGRNEQKRRELKRAAASSQDLQHMFKKMSKQG